MSIRPISLVDPMGKNKAIFKGSYSPNRGLFKKQQTDSISFKGCSGVKRQNKIPPELSSFATLIY